MFFNEIKRATSRLSFKIAIGVGLVFCITSLYSVKGLINMPKEKYFMFNMPAAFDHFIFFKGNPVSNVLIIILPLLSAISFSDSYLEDIKSGFLKSICTRKDKRGYLVSKYVSNFIISGLAFSIPLIINILILMLMIPSTETHAVLGMQTIFPTGLFATLYYSQPLLYIVMWIFIYFLYAGLYASIALSISVFIKNKFVVVIIPFIFSSLLEVIAEILNMGNFSPENFLYMCLKPSFNIILIEFIIGVILTFSLFYVGGNKHEIY